MLVPSLLPFFRLSPTGELEVPLRDVWDPGEVMLTNIRGWLGSYSSVQSVHSTQYGWESRTWCKRDACRVGTRSQRPYIGKQTFHIFLGGVLFGFL